MKNYNKFQIKVNQNQAQLTRIKRIKKIDSESINSEIKKILDKNMFFSKVGAVYLKDNESDKADFTKVCNSEHRLMSLLKRTVNASSNSELTSEEVKTFNNIMNNLSSNDRKKTSILFEIIDSISKNQKSTLCDLTNINPLYKKSLNTSTLLVSLKISKNQSYYILSLHYSFTNKSFYLLHNPNLFVNKFL